MIGVAQDNPGLYIVAQLTGMNPLDGSDRTYGHEYRRGNLTVISENPPGTGGGGAACRFQFKFHTAKLRTFWKFFVTLHD